MQQSTLTFLLLQLIFCEILAHGDGGWRFDRFGRPWGSNRRFENTEENGQLEESYGWGQRRLEDSSERDPNAPQDKHGGFEENQNGNDGFWPNGWRRRSWYGRDEDQTNKQFSGGASSSRNKNVTGRIGYSDWSRFVPRRNNRPNQFNPHPRKWNEEDQGKEDCVECEELEGGNMDIDQREGNQSKKIEPRRPDRRLRGGRRKLPGRKPPIDWNTRRGPGIPTIPDSEKRNENNQTSTGVTDRQNRTSPAPGGNYPSNTTISVPQPPGTGPNTTISPNITNHTVPKNDSRLDSKNSTLINRSNEGNATYFTKETRSQNKSSTENNTTSHMNGSKQNSTYFEQNSIRVTNHTSSNTTTTNSLNSTVGSHNPVTLNATTPWGNATANNTNLDGQNRNETVYKYNQTNSNKTSSEVGNHPSNTTTTTTARPAVTATEMTPYTTSTTQMTPASTTRMTPTVTTTTQASPTSRNSTSQTMYSTTRMPPKTISTTQATPINAGRNSTV